MEDEVSVSSLIGAAIEERPLDFKQSFNELMAARASEAIEQYKLGLAASTFGPPEDEDEDEEDEDETGWADDEELEDNEEE